MWGVRGCCCGGEWVGVGVCGVMGCWDVGGAGVLVWGMAKLLNHDTLRHQEA